MIFLDTFLMQMEKVFTLGAIPHVPSITLSKSQALIAAVKRYLSSRSHQAQQPQHPDGQTLQPGHQRHQLGQQTLYKKQQYCLKCNIYKVRKMVIIKDIIQFINIQERQQSESQVKSAIKKTVRANQFFLFLRKKLFNFTGLVCLKISALDHYQHISQYFNPFLAQNSLPNKIL